MRRENVASGNALLPSPFMGRGWGEVSNERIDSYGDGNSRSKGRNADRLRPAHGSGEDQTLPAGYERSALLARVYGAGGGKGSSAGCAQQDQVAARWHADLQAVVRARRLRVGCDAGERAQPAGVQAADARPRRAHHG